MRRVSVKPPPVETGLSVDDSPNELNIAFWVISSVGATRPLLLHIIYVSVHATSLLSSLSLLLSLHTSLHTHIAISLLYSLVSSIHIVFLSPGISLFPYFLSFIFLISSLSLSLPPFMPFPPLPQHLSVFIPSLQLPLSTCHSPSSRFLSVSPPSPGNLQSALGRRLC